MKLKHLAYHGGRKGTGSLGDNGLSNPIQQENVRLAITKALRLNYSISRRSKNQPFKKSDLSCGRDLDSGTQVSGSLGYCPLYLWNIFFNTPFFWHDLSFSLQEVDLHFPSSHIRNGKTCRSISILPAPPHIWYLMQTFWRLIPFPFVLWQSLTPWTVTVPSRCAICVEMTILAQRV